MFIVIKWSSLPKRELEEDFYCYKMVKLTWKRIKNRFLYSYEMAKLTQEIIQGAQKLTGENLKVVWAEFSTLS